MASSDKMDESLLYRKFYKIQLEKLGTEIAQAKSQLAEIADDFGNLRTSTANSEETTTKKLEQHHADVSRIRKETEDMAAVLGTWKGDFVNALEHQRKVMQRFEQQMEDVTARIEQIEPFVDQQAKDRGLVQAMTEFFQQPIQARTITNEETRPDISPEPKVPLSICLDVDFEPQGTKTLEQHLKYGQDTMMELYERNIRNVEAEQVKAFINTFSDEHTQSLLSQTLGFRGWSWATCQEEITKLVQKESDAIKAKVVEKEKKPEKKPARKRKR